MATGAVGAVSQKLFRFPSYDFEVNSLPRDSEYALEHIQNDGWNWGLGKGWYWITWKAKAPAGAILVRRDWFRIKNGRLMRSARCR